jgi:membrane-associated phospholipid phosphatase
MEVAVVYFAYLALVAMIVPVPGARRRRALVASVATLAVIVIAGMRHVMPMIYLLMAYWIPGMLVQGPNAQLEKQLLEADRTLFGADGLQKFERRAPRAIVEYLELAYLCCYLVVPVGFVWLAVGGYYDRVSGFWLVVLLASLICYGLLPWLPTRAPRALEGNGPQTRSAVRRFNVAILDRASVQWNTFPSGHTAASLATALAVGHHDPIAGVVFGVIAVSIAAGSVVGRYHYAADALAGAFVAVAAFIAANAMHGL